MTFNQAKKTPKDGWGRTENKFHLLASAAIMQATRNALNAAPLYDRAIEAGVSYPQLRDMQHDQIMDLIFPD